MILIQAVILVIVIALLLRRDLSAIGATSIKGGWKMGVAIVSLFLLQAFFVIFVPGQTGLQMIMLVLSQSALIGLFLLNHHLPGAKLFALGIFLNTAVIVANGGWMPVTPETAHFVHPDRAVELYVKPSNSKNVILPRSETNLWILSDIIRLTLPWRRNALSIGDLLLIAGIAQFVFQTTPKKKKRAASNVQHSLEEV